MSTTTQQVRPKQTQQTLTKVKFDKLTPDSFQRDVKRRVDQYFSQNNISKNANSAMVIKTVVILLGWLGTYGLIISNLLAPWAMLVLALVHGLFAAMIGFNIGHDAVHGSYSSNSKINKALGIIFNLAGANDYVWNISHNIVHHTYTNIPEHDGDITQIPILRVEPTQERWWIHRFQYIYAFALYSLASLSWVFIKDYVKFFQKRIGGHERKTLPTYEIFRLFFFKAVYYTIFLVIPLVVIDLAWYWILLGFVAAHLVEGFTLAIVFMLAHIIEGTAYPEPKENGQVGMPWADMQLYTTANFAIRSKVINFMFGGLNFQVEHHLFPNICHIHYPKIAHIVKETAHEHGLPYLEFRTFTGAIASHVRMLKKFGRE